MGETGEKPLFCQDMAVEIVLAHIVVALIYIWGAEVGCRRVCFSLLLHLLRFGLFLSSSKPESAE